MENEIPDSRVRHPYLISKEVFINDFLQGYPEKGYEEVEWWYDNMFTHFYEYLNEDVRNRVYLPRVGVIFTGTVPANPEKGLPERYRYRLSCKTFSKPK